MNSWPIIVFLGTAFFFATIFSIGVLILLTRLKLVRFKRPSDFITWGIVGGLLISSIFVAIECNNTSHRQENVVNDSTVTQQ
jgi:hypothetical protein